MFIAVNIAHNSLLSYVHTHTYTHQPPPTHTHHVQECDAISISVVIFVTEDALLIQWFPTQFVNLTIIDFLQMFRSLKIISKDQTPFTTLIHTAALLDHELNTRNIILRYSYTLYVFILVVVLLMFQCKKTKSLCWRPKQEEKKFMQKPYLPGETAQRGFQFAKRPFV